ncbi:MAG: ATP-binding protein [Chloroflexi bacterium]|nr:ATP-binding protein [Chloroflexota bacterium]
MNMKARFAYSDEPALSGGLLPGSWRLLFWLFFHPAAWRAHIAAIDPHLSPDFCMAELSRAQWRRPAFWRLMVMLFLAWPFLLMLLVAASLWLLGLPTQSIALGVIVGVGVALLASLAASLVGSLVIGTAVGLGTGVVTGIAAGLVLGEAANPLTAVPNFSLDLVLGTVIGLSSGLSGGLAYGVTMGVTGRLRDLAPAYSLPRQISGVIVGVFVGMAGGFIVGGLTESWLTGLALGLPFALAIGWRTRSWRRGLVWGALLSLAVALVAGLALSPAEAGLWGAALIVLRLGATMLALFALPYVLAERIAGPWAGALAGVLGSGSGLFLLASSTQAYGPIVLFTLAGILLGLTLGWWRPVVGYPFIAGWNMLLLRLDERRLPQGRPSLIRWHSAFWDELQRLPLSGLDTHILLLRQYDPAEGTAVMEFLGHGRQRWAAQAVQIETDARQLAACQDIQSIGAVYQTLAAGELSGPASALLRSFSRISRDVAAALNQESAYNQRLALNAVEDRLDGLLRELTRSSERYADRFRPIAAAWRAVVAGTHQQLVAEAELRQEIDSPYIIGVPLTERQAIFVGRADVSARIEQLLLDRRQPPLLLYGQRRVGKTSLLNNLGRLLPSTIIPLFVDLQGPATRASDEAGFLYNLARALVRSAGQRDLALPPLTRDDLAVDPFSQFEEWLDAVELALGDSLALLMLDEFEVLADALERRRFDEVTVMGMVRHLIQHRSRFKVLLSGSHTLDEFQRWAGYLINVQVVHIGYLSPAETRQLVTQPVSDFALRYEAAAQERVIALTRGHPFLVQLLCAEIVALKNEQPPEMRRLARVADVETAVSEALQHGSFFFADIEQNQVDVVGREVLRLMATSGEGEVTPRQKLVAYVPSLMALEESLVYLQRRELIEAVGDGYCFQVELVRRWFAARP